jgi:predicted lipoprotein with Yx(FWY)xxD motif
VSRFRALALAGAATVACAVGSVGLAAAHTRPAARATSVLKLEHSRFGPILIDGSDRVVYLFSKNVENRELANSCTRACARVWPALLAAGFVRAGKGVNPNLLGSLPDGRHRRQVTYAGYRLYLHAGSRASDLASIGVVQFGGVWEGVKANGAGVR